MRHNSGNPFILDHLIEIIINSAPQHSTDLSARNRRSNPKLVEGALDLLAAMIKGQARLAHIVRTSRVPGTSQQGEDEELGHPAGRADSFMSLLETLSHTGSSSTRLAAVAW
jgi:hypothetical protein